MFGYAEHPYGFYSVTGIHCPSEKFCWILTSIILLVFLFIFLCLMRAVLAMVFFGLLYGFFVAIICGQRITRRHYHVLEKQELTKVWLLDPDKSSSLKKPNFLFYFAGVRGGKSRRERESRRIGVQPTHRAQDARTLLI